jgi:TRAP-type C4-dicarboxylate transport system substrate-binding protein
VRGFDKFKANDKIYESKMTKSRGGEVNRKKLLTLLGGVCLALVLTILLLPGCAQEEAPAPGAETEKPAQTMEWGMTNFGSPATFWYDTHVNLGNMITEMSDGRITFKHYAGDVLYPVDKALENTGLGVTEMAGSSAQYFVGVEPAFGLSFMPGSVLSMDGELYFQDLPEYKEIWQGLYNKYNCQWVGPWWVGARTNMLSKKPINKLDDFKGVTFRSTGTTANLLSKYGAKVVDVSGPEIYTALATGTVDAFEYGSYALDWSMSFQEVTKYMIEPTIQEGWGHCDYFVNMDAWNKLPADLQSIIKGAVGAHLLPEQLGQMRLNDEARQNFIDYGLQVCTLPPEDVLRAYKIAGALWDELATKDAVSAQLVNMYKQICKLYGLE